MLTACLAVAWAAGSCSGSADDSSSPDPVPELDATTTTAPTTTADSDTTTTTAQFGDPAIALAGVDGLVAVAGPSGLRVLTPTGDVVAEFGEDLQVTQPTWSRDSTRLVATFIDPVEGEISVAIIDTATWELTTTPAARPYFFYTWNDDASLFAALGNAGGGGGTAVDILDASGMPAANAALIGGSMYVAWEPGGNDLLLHADDEMRLIDDLAAVENFVGDKGADE